MSVGLRWTRHGLCNTQGLILSGLDTRPTSGQFCFQKTPSVYEAGELQIPSLANLTAMGQKFRAIDLFLGKCTALSGYCQQLSAIHHSSTFAVLTCFNSSFGPECVGCLCANCHDLAGRIEWATLDMPPWRSESFRSSTHEADGCPKILCSWHLAGQCGRKCATWRAYTLVLRGR